MNFKNLGKKADTKLKPQNSENLFGLVLPKCNSLKKSNTQKPRITQFVMEEESSKSQKKVSGDDELKNC
jgi:hypothetical protein